MSGGHFSYRDGQLLHEMYGWDTEGKAATANPYQDFAVSQLMYDLLKLTHDLDWCESGDTCEEDYRKSLNSFKRKWLGEKTEETILEIANSKIEDLRTEIYNMIKRQEDDV